MNTLPIQQFIEVEDIQEGTIVLKNKTLRAVLMCSSVNFELKSSEEQEATLYQFQNFLNSLDFYLQFLVRSRKLDISKYLDDLRQKEKAEENELMKIQTQEYTEFIDGLVKLQNIMSKTFYAIVPLDVAMVEIADPALRGGLGGVIANLFNTKKKDAAPPDVGRDEQFQKNKSQLAQRVVNVSNGLRAVGIKAVQLNNEELKELLYNSYNI